MRPRHSTRTALASKALSGSRARTRASPTRISSQSTAASWYWKPGRGELCTSTLTVWAWAAPMSKSRLISRERILYPFDMIAVQQHGIEAAGPLAVADQPVTGGEDQPPLLGGGNAGAGAAEIVAGTEAHLHENRGIAFPADQVYLAAADAEISLDEMQAPAGQMIGRPRLGLRTLLQRHTMTAMDTSSSLPLALYVVATPIGNLADITLRAVEVLKSAAVVACEDTRHTRRLLDHHGIRAPTLALHEHNEQAAAAKVIALLGEGKAVALVSDAG